MTPTRLEIAYRQLKTVLSELDENSAHAATIADAMDNIWVSMSYEEMRRINRGDLSRDGADCQHPGK